MGIAKFNNFPISAIHKLNNKIKAKIKHKKLTKLHNNDKIKKAWGTIRYCGNISEKIGQMFQKHNINIGYKPNNIIKKKLQNINHNKDKLNCSGIYELNCTCGLKYIGRTTRKFTQRFREHKHNFIYNKPEKSTFANHLLQHHHPLNTDLFKIIKILNNNKTIDIWENVEILKAHKMGNILNEQIPDSHNPIYKFIISS